MKIRIRRPASAGGTADSEHEDANMPNNWSEAERRLYERAKRSELERGRSEELAEEIARRTVRSARHDPENEKVGP